MDCTESRQSMAAYVDEELDPSAAAQLRAHLATCASCADAYQDLLNLRSAVKTQGMRYAAPAHLRQRIQAALPRQSPVRRKLARLPWAWINFGVATAFGVAFAVALVLQLAVPTDAERLDQEIVSSHYRSLLANHLADVVSSDQHTVKPWFSGKLDFSPPVYDLAQQGFPLVGGRLDYLDGRAVAALAYRHRQHVLNLFVWPDKTNRSARLQVSSRQGYQLATWSEAGLHYSVISDMNPQDLIEFKRVLEAQIARGG